MSESRLNIELFKRLRNRFARMRHPKHFRMKQIAIKTECGAAMCFIGHTLDLEGYKKRPRSSVVADSDDPARCDYDFIRPDGSIVEEPFDDAQNLLRLDFYEAKRMFHRFSLRTPQQAVNYLERIIRTEAIPK